MNVWLQEVVCCSNSMGLNLGSQLKLGLKPSCCCSLQTIQVVVYIHVCPDSYYVQPVASLRNRTGGQLLLGSSNQYLTHHLPVWHWIMVKSVFSRKRYITIKLTFDTLDIKNYNLFPLWNIFCWRYFLSMNYMAKSVFTGHRVFDLSPRSSTLSLSGCLCGVKRSNIVLFFLIAWSTAVTRDKAKKRKKKDGNV